MLEMNNSIPNNLTQISTKKRLNLTITTKPSLINKFFLQKNDLQTIQIEVSQNLAKIQNLADNNNEFEKKYEILKQIGDGGSAAVYKVKNIQDGQIYAAKIINAFDEEMYINYQKEFKIQEKLEHKCLLQAKEMILNPKINQIVLIFEYCASANLYTYLQKKIKFSEQEIIVIVQQLLDVLSYIHSQKIIHRDVTLNNILYCQKSKEIKLIDFGIARSIADGEECIAISPTSNPQYTSPECKKLKPITEKTDIWGLGLSILQLILNKPIQSNQFQKKLNKENCYLNKISSTEFSEHFKNLLTSFLEIKAKNRLSAMQYIAMINKQQQQQQN